MSNFTGSQSDDVFNWGAGGHFFGTAAGKGGKSFATTANSDTVKAGAGNDKIDTGGGDDFAYGENGNDLIWLGLGNDQGAGGNGDDEIHGEGGNDLLWGDTPGNANTSDNGSDKLYGDAGNDEIHGGNAKDFLWGGADNDTLFGDNGVDWLRGGTGADDLWGGLGGDVQIGCDTGGADGSVDVFHIDTNSNSAVSDSPYKLGAPIAGPNYTNMDVWDVIVAFDGNQDKINLELLNAHLTGGGPTQLTWRGTVGSDTTAAAAAAGLVHGVWTDTTGTFLYADITGDGKADMKIQVSGVDGGDFIGVNMAPETNDVNICAVEDDSSIAITLGGSDTDGTVDNFHIINLPSNGVLATDTAGSNPVAADSIVAAGTTLYFIPDANWSGTATFNYAAIDNDSAEDATPATVSIDVAPVADAPTLDLDTGTGGDQHSAVASGTEDTNIALDIAAALVDTDGSETLTITISGVPAGATLSAGDDQGGGVWLLDPTDLAGLTINAADPGSFTLTVTATATEADPGFDDPDCDDTSDNVATTVGTIDVTVNQFEQEGDTDGDPPSNPYFNPDDGLSGIDNGTFLNDGTVLGNFTADADTGIVWAITSVTAADASDTTGYFAIDASTGVLSATDNVPIGTYTIDISATDDDGSTPYSLIVAVGDASGNTINLGAAGTQVLAFSLAGIDNVTTGGYDDVIVAGGNNDTVIGGAGVDFIYGGAGDDQIRGGDGADTLYGGGNNDTFIYNAASESPNTVGGFDVIEDWDASKDTIDINIAGVDSSDLSFDTVSAPGYTLVSINTDDGIAGDEMVIKVLGAITTADFTYL